MSSVTEQSADPTNKLSSDPTGALNRKLGELSVEEEMRVYGENNHKQSRTCDEEMHDMKMTILREEREAQKLLWSEKMILLQKESDAKLEAIKEVKDAELESVAAEQKVKVQAGQERITAYAKGTAESTEMRKRLMQEEHDAQQSRRQMMHALMRERLPGPAPTWADIARF